MPPKALKEKGGSALLYPEKGSGSFFGRSVLVYVTATGLALLVTLGIFAMVPWMIGPPPDASDLERMVSVQLRDLRPPEPEPEPEPPKPPEEKPPEPDVPMEQIMQRPLPEVPQMEPIPFTPDLRLSAVPGPAIAPPPPAGPMTFEAGEVDVAPRTMVQTPPIYPFRARRMGIEGWVRVRFLVGTDGVPRNIHVLEADPEGVFEDAVIQAISNWRFEAAVMEGRRVAAWVVTPIRFQLGGN
ncbi:energy transducer TonB [Desulfobotulus sp. H1]|uniref:Protein TonB n=1 Tax=Desulfobotulus pelophilus TaxID=2823377 RepID=A0ABT3N8W3_9BACT|nr:energy transducer TonB [Desulfobotulus pelophilus]MCW7753895.1 energy transducer TonB [Desulfobotulus pelophilus]